VFFSKVFILKQKRKRGGVELSSQIDFSVIMNLSVVNLIGLGDREKNKPSCSCVSVIQEIIFELDEKNRNKLYYRKFINKKFNLVPHSCFPFLQLLSSEFVHPSVLLFPFCEVRFLKSGKVPSLNRSVEEP